MRKNMQMFKKIMALLLVFCMVFGMTPVPAAAAMIDELGDLFQTTADGKAITINVASGAETGTVTADKESAVVGEKITFKITPAEGYKLGYIRIAGIDYTASVVDGVLEYTLGNNTGRGVYVEAKFVPAKLTFEVSGYEIGADVTKINASDTNAGLSFEYGMTIGICTSQGVDGLMESGSFESGKDYWLLLASENNDFAAYTADEISVSGVEGAKVVLDSTYGDTMIWVKLPQLTESAAPTTYGITVSESENGTVTADKAEAAEGETVTLTVTPAVVGDTTYKLQSLTVSDAEVTKVNNTTYTFVMPASDVTVSAVFSQAKKLEIVTKGEGTVTADMEAAFVGEKITFKITPAEGYKLGYIRIAGIDYTASVVDGVLEYTLGNNTGRGVYVEAKFVPAKLTFEVSGYEIGADVTKIKVSDTKAGLIFNYGMTMGICTAQELDGLMESGSFESGKDYWLLLASENNDFAAYTADEISVSGVEGAKVVLDSTYGDTMIWVKLPQLSEAAAPTTYGITVNESENGTVTADKATAAEGETVTLTVTPAEGYELDTLTAGELELTKVNDTTYTFVMPASAVAVSASFKLLPVTYAVNVSETLGGTVTADKAKAAEGDTVTLTVKAADYYEPDTLSVTDAAGNEVPVTNNIFTMPAGEVTVSATFKQTSGMEQYFTVTVDGVEYPAQYIGEQIYDEKNNKCEAFLVKLPAGTTGMTVDSDYKLYVLNMANISIAKGDDPIDLPVNGAVTTYKLNSYLGTSSPHYCYLRVELPAESVTVNVSGNGEVEADKTLAAPGETVTLSVFAKKGYQLDTLTVTDAKGNDIEVTQKSNGDYTFVMPENAVTVNASFIEIPAILYDVILNPSENGTVTADKASAEMGATVQLTVTPNEGYQLKSLTVLNSAGAQVALAEDYSFVMPGSPVDVTAVFEKASTAKLFFTVDGYMTDNLAKHVDIVAAEASGTDVTNDWDCGIVTSPDGALLETELNAQTQYWLKCSYNGNDNKYSNYTANDFDLKGVEYTDVQITNTNGECIVCFKLPLLKEAAKEYQIITDNVYDGSVKAFVNGKEVTKACAGDNVTLVATPNNGYALDQLYVLDPYGAVVPSVPSGVNSYSFVMPDSWVWLDVIFRQVTVDGKTTIALGDLRDVYPGDKIFVPVNVEVPPTGSYYQFDMKVDLPEGWKSLGVKSGKDSDMGGKGFWNAEFLEHGHWGMVAQGVGNLTLPKGEILFLILEVPADAKAGTYKLDLYGAGMSDGRTDGASVLISQQLDGYVTVKAAPAEKIKLNTPNVENAQIIAFEDMIETRNVPGCPQESGAALEYRFAETKDALENAEWMEGTVPDGIKEFTEDDVTWLNGDLKAGTEYIFQIRYKAYNTSVYIDSEIYETKITTKSWIDTPVEISTTDAVTGPGETFTVKVSLDHAFGDKAFIEKDLSLNFNSEYFTLTKFNKTNFGGKTLNAGEVAELTFKVNDNVEPGTYSLDLTTENPIYLRDNRDGSGFWRHNREYPVNHEFVSGTITVLEACDPPVLTDAVALENSVTVTAPFVVDGIKVEYSISKDGGYKWGEWQSSNVFEGLDADTEYHFRARYVPDGSTKYSPSAPSNVISATTSYDDITFVLGDAKALPGETVVIPVTVSHELTKDATSVIITPAFNKESLEFVSAELGEGVTGDGWKVLAGNGVVQIYKIDESAFAVPEGTVLNLTFKVLKSGDLKAGLAAEIYSGDALMSTEANVTEGNIHVHNKVTVEGSAATCYGEGLTDGEKCSLCEEVLKEQTVIKAKGHILKETVVAPSHNQMGYTLVECEACDYAEIKDFTKALDHDYVESVTKEATCTENGEMTFTCECGESYTQLIPKADHDCEAIVTDATCESIGYTTYDCKNCDYSYVNDINAALGHKETVVNAKEATHDDAGYTGDTVCSVCKEVLEQGKEIAAWGCPAKDFSDVDTTKWYHDAVDYVLMNKLMTGTGNGLFAPNDNTTRAMMATLLYRMAGEPSVEGLENPFTDVKAGTWYTDAIIWAADKGVVSGTSATTFAPDQQITREQMVTMIWRYAGEPDGDVSVLDKYEDADSVSDYAKEAMAWAISNGIVTGMSDTLLAPQNTATRAQIAAILMRYCEM